MFVGTFEHSLDDKGRIVLPSNFRDRLAPRGFLSQFDVCLGLWSEEGFEAVAQRLREEIQRGNATQEAMRAFAANAHEVRPDSQGRITIPQRLRDFAGLERDAVIIGAVSRIEIWNPTRWTTSSPGADESLSKAVKVLGL